MAMKEENKIEGFLFGTNLFENLTEADFIREIDNCLKLSEKYDSIKHPTFYCKNQRETDKKEVELDCLKKFLSLYNSSLEIEEVTEKPDFILRDKDERIGLELIQLTSSKVNPNDVCIAKLFKEINKLAISEYPDCKKMICCNINESLKVTNKDIRKYSKIIFDQLREFIKYDPPFEVVFEDKTFMNELYITKHSSLLINYNYSATYCEDATIDEINDLISDNKENKIESYKKEHKFDQLWLLIYVNSSDITGQRTLDESVFDNDALNEILSNSFDKIFISTFSHYVCLKG